MRRQLQTTIRQFTTQISSTTNQAKLQPYKGMSDLLSRKRSLHNILHIGHTTEDTLSREELIQLYNLSCLQVPTNESDFAAMQKTITEFTSWLSIISNADTNGAKPVYSSLEYITSSINYNIPDSDNNIHTLTKEYTTETGHLFLREDKVTEGDNTNQLLQSAQTVKMNHYVVPASNNGEE